MTLLDASRVREHPGEGLEGEVDGRQIRIVGRRQAEAQGLALALPPAGSGLECILLVDGDYAATYRFHDSAREDSRSFIAHLGRGIGCERILLVSGDREPEVRYLADRVGIRDVHAQCSPEDKVAITRAESRTGDTLFVGDGINDAPALAAATVGIAFGHQSEITTEAAGAVIMDTALRASTSCFTSPGGCGGLRCRAPSVGWR